MSPVKDNIISSAIETLQDIFGGLGEVEVLEAKVHETLVEVLQARDNIVAGVVIRMPEDEDVGMKRPEGFLGVLLLSVLV